MLKKLTQNIKTFEQKSVLTRKDREIIGQIIEEAKAQVKKLTSKEFTTLLPEYKKLIDNCKTLLNKTNKTDECKALVPYIPSQKAVVKSKRRSLPLPPIKDVIQDNFNLTLPIVITLESEDSEEEENIRTMAEFNLDTGLKLPELTSAKIGEINSFLAVVDIYHKKLKSSAQEELITFVCAAKIKGEAKTRFRSKLVKTFAELEAILRKRVLSGETQEELTRKLKMARQGRRSIHDFGKYLDELSERLAAAILREDASMNKETVEKQCDMMALTQLKEGCHDELKDILVAARPKNMDDAIAVAASTPQSSGESVMTFNRGQGNFRGRGRQNYNNNRRYNNNNNQQNRRRYDNNNSGQHFNNNNAQRYNHNNNYQRNNNSNQWRQNSNGQRYNGNNRQYNNNNNSGRRHQQHSVNVAQGQQMQNQQGQQSESQQMQSQQVHVLGN